MIEEHLHCLGRVHLFQRDHPCVALGPQPLQGAGGDQARHVFGSEEGLQVGPVPHVVEHEEAVT